MTEPNSWQGFEPVAEDRFKSVVTSLREERSAKDYISLVLDPLKERHRCATGSPIFLVQVGRQA